MNKCFLIGKIISKIKFDFVISNKKTNKISRIEFYIKLKNNNIIKIIAYNELADKCFRELEKEEIIIIQGRINTLGEVELEEFFCLENRL